MEYNYNTKYKDRTPKETIEIVQNFFKKRGYRIQIADITHSESNTWSCCLKLYYDKYLINSSCGKGMTEEFSLASGYAEMYERFCNKLTEWNSIPLFEKICQLNLEKNGYYLFSNEKIMTLEEILAQSRIPNKVLKAFFHNDKEILNSVLLLPKVEKIIGAPYQGFNCSDIKYLDPRIMSYIGSSGMAAGNSLEEAINQGLSEVLEHYCFCQMMKNAENLQFYELNLNNVQNAKLQDCIKNIEDNGNKIRILDLSYTFGFPVLLAIIFNKLNCSITVDCGSFPIFDIALERVITEAYQNESTMNDLVKGLQFPWNEDSWDIICLKNRWNFTYAQTFPEIIFNKAIKVDSYNQEVFLSNNEDNIQINKYYKNLLNKCDLHCYFLDTSLSDKMAAVWVFVEELDGFEEISTCYPNNYKNVRWDKIDISNILKNTKYLFNNLNIVTNERIIEFFLQQKFYNSNERWFLFDGLNEKIFYLHRPRATPTNIPYLINKLFDVLGNLSEFKEEELKNLQQYSEGFCSWLVLQRYIKNKYSLKEIQSIFSNFKIYITEQDIQKAFDPGYIIEKLLLIPFRNEINSNLYKCFVQTLIL